MAILDAGHYGGDGKVSARVRASEPQELNVVALQLQEMASLGRR
jgi:hypothetical protein